MRVSVHPNRHKYLAGEDACVSVTVRENGRQRTFYKGHVTLKNCTLRVRPSGVRRAQAERKRNVHAWGVGESLAMYPTRRYSGNGLSDYWKKVTYHYESGEFRILSTGENVTGMTFEYAFIDGRDFYVFDKRVV
jgi:hypothetical protein